MIDHLSKQQENFHKTKRINRKLPKNQKEDVMQLTNEKFYCHANTQH